MSLSDKIEEWKRLFLDKEYRKKHPKEASIANGAAVFVLLLALFLILQDHRAPSISLGPDTEGLTNLNKVYVVDIVDKSGIKSIDIIVHRGSQSLKIAEYIFDETVTEFSTEFIFAEAKLPDGAFSLEIQARDKSYAKLGFGNKSSKKYHFEMDTQAPKISVLSPSPSVRRGGSGLVTYSTSLDVVETGITFDGLFFPAYPNADGDYVCLFPFPYFLGRSNYVPEIMAKDKAGNVTSSRLMFTLVNRIFLDDEIKITDTFLANKEEELRKIYPSDLPILEVYKIVNNQIRQENQAVLKELSKLTAPKFHFTESFLRQPKSVVRGSFGDSRTYTYNGEKFDFQYHTGIDFASVKEDTVVAANKGEVIYTGYLGIYGNLVVVDHGRGLQSLYSHLTDTHVKVGDMVERGDSLGTTGISGLAVGDHLHLGFMINGIEVQPTEWFDAVWVRNNITSRMKY